MVSKQGIAQLYEECQLIGSREVRRLAEAILRCAPGDLWEQPSSRSGQHHPPDEVHRGGAVLHAKRCVCVAMHLSRAFDIEPIDRDVLIAAMLVHDIGVNTCADDREADYLQHPLRVREMTDALSGRPHYDAVMSVVEAHMGRWGPAEHWQHPSPLQKLGHLADFIASRRDILVRV